MQAAALLAVMKVPEAQAEQPRSATAVPGELTKVPATQARLAMQAVAGLPSASQVSPTHGEAPVLPPAQCSPALHFKHTRSDDEVAEAICRVPAGQSVAARQVDSLGPCVYVPEGQLAQFRSDMGVGAEAA
jgi:hypothetical protein